MTEDYLKIALLKALLLHGVTARPEDLEHAIVIVLKRRSQHQREIDAHLQLVKHNCMEVFRGN